MNASNKINNNFRLAMNAAAKNRAVGLFVWFAFWFVVGFVLTLVFGLLAKGCVALLGETLGLIVYLILSFGAIYALEVYSTRALRRR